MNTKILLLCSILIAACATANRTASTEITVLDKPATAATNAYYVSNRAPLKPSVLIKLPVGTIKPEGWLKVYLERQAEGLSGQLGEISAWLQKDGNAWLAADGKGDWGWEEVPYWLKGYANLGYILEREDIIAEAKIWLEAALNSQREDGNFGPYFDQWKEVGAQDFWANMIMLYCLQSYYEYSQDKRVIDLMTRYFQYELTVPDSAFLSEKHYWQRIRGGDNLHSVFWLYNRTGEKWLLDLAEKIHRNTAPWASRGHGLEAIGNHKEIREGMEWPDWYGNLIDWHNVNVAQGFREPAQYYLLSHKEEDLQATYDNFWIVRQHFGQVPGGMFGADENARPGYADPRQGVETCGMVEQMNSDEHLLRITGDIFWADHAEDVAFNSYPAAVMPDFRALRYITSPNMVLNDDQNHSPGIDNGGPFLMMNPFSSRCCQHNHTQGWPYFTENLWMATPDNGLAAVLYAANTVTATVGTGTEVRIQSATNYPFEEQIQFTINASKSDTYPLYFRIPNWCSTASLRLNGKPLDVDAKSGKYVRINRRWKDGDTITLNLPKQLQIRNWEQNHNSVSVDYGPLTFSLKIGEEYVKKESDKTAVWDSKWQENADREKWPAFEIRPTTAWNYGLILDTAVPTQSFSIETKPWPADNFPFTVASAPIVLKAKAKKIPAWKLDDYGLAGELKNSPVQSSEPIETVELIPMGAARLRISAFPVIGEGEDANRW